MHITFLKYNKQIVRTILFVLIGLSSLNSTKSYSATWEVKKTLSPLEKQFVDIENLSNRKNAIPQWKLLLNELNDDTPHPVITSKLIRDNIVQDYIKTYKNEQYIDLIIKAQKDIRSWSDTQNKAWALIALLDTMAYSEKILGDVKTYEVAQDLIDTIAVN